MSKLRSRESILAKPEPAKEHESVRFSGLIEFAGSPWQMVPRRGLPRESVGSLFP